MPIKVPVVQTGLEASIQAAAKKAGKAMKIDMGAGAKSIEGLSQPLGRITGKADQFTKSMEAANARVLAFGASVGVLSAVSRGFQELVKTTIEVEKQLTSINSILGGTSAQLQKFKKEIFDVARNTEQSFETVSEAALELSRQGLKAEVVVERLNDSLILARLSGLGASEAVFGLTAAINSFRKEGISSAEVLNKLSAAAISAAVSEKDLIEGIKRSGSVATQAGVSFNELIGVITAVQERTARGGAVIGNSFKTIFTRIQSIEKLETMQNLGVQVTDAGGQVLGATKLIENLAKTLATLPDAKRLQIAENLVGKFQIAPFLAILEDYNSATSTAIRVTEVAAGATSEAYQRNIAISKTLSHAINETVLSVKELADTLGTIGVTDSLRGILDFFSNLTANINKVLEGDTLGSKFAKGIVKGIGGVLSGPGLAIFGAIIAKLTLDLARFGLGSLKTFFGLNKAAKEQATLQGQIASTLLGNKDIQQHILNIERSSLSAEQKKVEQTRFFTIALREQLKIMTTMQGIATRVAPGVMRGTRGRGRGAGGYIPNFNVTMGYGSEQADINRGVGGAPKGARPVTVPNFNFGGGQRGTMVANSSEYLVPNFGGSGGSAVFNQDMVSSMGLPAGARKISAAGGYVPNFAAKKGKKGMIDAKEFFYLVPQMKAGPFPLGQKTIKGVKVGGGQGYGFKKGKVKTVSDKEEDAFAKRMRASIFRHTARFTQKFQPLGRTASSAEIRQGFDNEKGAKGALQAVMGSAFEVGIIKALDYKAAIREKGGDFDVRLGTNIEKIRELFGLPKSKNTGDFKVSTSPGNIESFYKKVIREREAGNLDLRSEKRSGSLKLATQMVRQDPKFSGMFGSRGQVLHKHRATVGAEIQRRLPAATASFTRSASGYIPNFASPLEDAIAREKAAGLPISQIRVNQDGGLRNPANPQGLAVTNMRDEPTGAIPNFARRSTQLGLGKNPRPSVRRQGNFGSFDRNTIKAQKEYTQSLKGSTAANKDGEKGQRDMLGGIFAVQLGMSALQGATSGATEGFGLLANRVTTLGSSFTTAAFAGSAIDGFGKSIGGKGGGIISKIGIWGAALGASAAALKFSVNVFEDSTGITDNTNTAIAALGDASTNAARKLNSLSKIDQKTLMDEANRLVGAKAGAKVLAHLESRIKSPGVVTTKEVTSSGGAGTMGAPATTKTVTSLERQTLRFKGSKTKDILAAAIAEARAGGRTQESINKELIKLGLRQEGGKSIKEGEEGFKFEIDPTELKIFAAFLTETNKLVPEIQKRIADLDLSGADFMTPHAGNIAAQGPTPGAMGGGFGDLVRTLAADLNIDEKTTKEIVLAKQLEDIEKRKQKAKQEGIELDRIATSLAKQQIATAIQRAKTDRTVLDQMDERVLKAELSKHLTEDEVIALKTEQQVLQANFDLRGKTLDAVGNMAQASQELTFVSEKELALRDLITESAKKTKLTEEERKDLIAKTRELLEESDDRIKDVLGKELDRLETEEKLTGELIKQLEKLGLIRVMSSKINQERAAADIGALGEVRSGSFNRREALEAGIRARELNRINRSRGAFSTLGSEGLEKQALQDAVTDALDNAAIGNIDLAEGQIGKTATLLGKLGEDQLTQLADKRDFQGVISAGNLAKEFGTGILKDAQEVTNKITDKAEFKEQLKAFGEQRDALRDQSAATLANAEANLKAAGFFGLSQKQILENMGTDLARGANQGAVDAALATNPAQRAKLLMREASRGREAAALSAGDTGLVRSIREQDEFKGVLIDASYEFAQNIGDAMTQAIIQGGNLGDILRSAATDFFTLLSKAYMSRAVDQLVGTGGGGGLLSALFGKKNSGGLIRGGSGSRDDVPTLLTGGEFVVRKGAVEKYGTQFFEGLNTGSVGQMQRGGLFTPGTYGQGSITGKGNLLDFATQSYTSGQFDQVSGGAGFGSASLEPQSARLTMFGRRNSPLFQREQDSKREAFGLYTRQVQYEQQVKEQNEQDKKNFRNSLLAAAASAALSYGIEHISETLNKPQDANVEPRGLSERPAGPASDTFTPTPRNRRTSVNMTPGVAAAAAPVPLPLDTFASDMVDLDIPDSALREILHRHPTDGSPFRNNPQQPLTQAQRSDIAAGGHGGLNWYGNAAGGYISPTAGVDTVPSMLSGGEFVMNAAATQRMGRGNLAALNSGGGGEGGDGAIVAAINNLGDELGGSGETIINITVNSDGTETQDGNGDDQQQNLALKIKDVVRQTIQEEKRLGGSLRRQ